MAKHRARDKDPYVSVSPGFGSRLRYARELRNMSQFDLAAKVAVRPATVSRNETDATNPKKSTAAGYCAALEISELWLLQGIGPGPGEGPIEADPHAELLAQYYASPYGITTPPDIRARLAKIAFADLGIPIPTLRAVHDMRLFLEQWATAGRHSRDGEPG